MGDAVLQRIPLSRRARLEHRPRDVPLEEMNAPARPGREMGELVDEQTLAGSGKPREEHQAPRGQAAQLSLERGGRPEDDARGYVHTLWPPKRRCQRGITSLL